MGLQVTDNTSTVQNVLTNTDFAAGAFACVGGLLEPVISTAANSGLSGTGSSANPLAVCLSTDANNALSFGTDGCLYAPVANVLTNATWSDATNTITLTFSDASTIDIPIVDAIATFIHEYTLAADTGTAETIQPGDTITIAGGTNVATVVGATDTVTINMDVAPADICALGYFTGV